MGQSKELFQELRLAEYEHNFSKQECQMQGNELAERFTEEYTPQRAVSNLVRLSEVINTALSNLKEKIIIDKPITENGVKFQHIQGGKIYDFAKDATWQHYQSKIDEAKAMQKLREKQLIKATESEDDIIVDDEILTGVPLKGYRKSYIKITY